MQYIGLGILIIVTAFATAVLGPWMFAVLAVGLVFWFLVEWPLFSLGVLLLGVLAGQLVRIPVGGGTVVPSDLLLFAAVSAWVLRKLVRREAFVLPSPLNAPLIVLDIVMMLSLLWATLVMPLGEVLNGALYFLRFLAYQMIFFLVQSSAQGVGHIKRLFSMVLGTGVLLGVLGFLQLVIFPDFSFMVPEGWDPHAGRLLSTWFDPNLLGGLFAFLAVLVLAQILSGERVSLTRLMALSILIAALLLTFSRSSYVAFVLGFFVIILLTIRRSWWMLIFGVAVLVVSFLSSPRIQERVEGIFTIDVTAQKRIESWSSIIFLASEHPLLGVGYNTLRYAQFEEGLITDPGEHSAGGSDSSLLTILATTGIVGLLAFVWLSVSAVALSWKVFVAKHADEFSRGLGLGMIGGLAVLFAHSQFVNSLLYPHILAMVWMVLGMLVWISGTESRSKNQEPGGEKFKSTTLNS
ncbi:MAG TPA: O-antigen ligase family protein [Patescibacteria group bacterium]|nr:O-antigen ligase family protein [Patescibacteria group bacterium]